MANTVTEEIVQLLEQGKSSREIIALDYKPGTVFGTQRKWRRQAAAKQSPPSLPESQPKHKKQQFDLARKEVESLKKAVKELTLGLDECEEHIGEIITRLENSPLTGIKERFKCSSCGTTGLLAVKLRCTKCNGESWWGWHPQKQ